MISAAAFAMCLIPAFFESDLIFEPQEKHVHSSSIVELANGDLLATWFYGSGERSANDVVIQGARKKSGDATWSPVFTMADTPGLPDCNPVLFVDGQERLWLFWLAVQSNRWERSILKYRRSTDYLGDGPPHWDWQDVILFKPGERLAEQMEKGFDALGYPEPMWAEYAPQYTEMLIDAARDPVKRDAGWMTRTPLAILPSGRIVLPLYSDGFNISITALSDDDGATWRLSEPIVGLGNIQPAIVRGTDGTLTAYMRDNGVAPPRMMTAESSDEGETWTFATDTEIPNPGSSVAVASLSSGEWVLVCNDTDDGRHRIVAMLSTDEGKTWSHRRVLDEAGNEAGSYSYPTAIVGDENQIHLTYSYKSADGAAIKYVTFDSDWLRDDSAR